MKKILVSTGGFPLRLDDILVLQENILEGFKHFGLSLGRNLGSYIFRLYGCEITVTNSGGIAPTLNITAGSIFKSDQIYFVDAIVNQILPDGTTLLDVQNNWYWSSTSVDTDSRVFLDATTHTVLRIEKAVLIDNATGNWLNTARAVLPYFLEVATNTQATAGLNDNSYMSPYKTKLYYESKKASGAEVIAETNDDKYVTSLALASKKASTIEANTGTDDAKYITPYTLNDVFINHYATADECIEANGTDKLVRTTDLRLYYDLAGSELTMNSALFENNTGTTGGSSIAYVRHLTGIKKLHGSVHTKAGLIANTGLLITEKLALSSYIYNCIGVSTGGVLYEIFTVPTLEEIHLRRIDGLAIESNTDISFALTF